MQITEKNGRKQIWLQTEEELRAYVHPLRQRILQLLALAPAGMTAKQLADRLGIAPSSAGHHLAALEKIGLVRLARTELIHGLTAKYYEAAPADICLRDTEPAAAEMKNALMQDAVNGIYARMMRAAREMEEQGKTPGPGDGDTMTGVLHLTRAEAAELHETLLAFFAAHDRPREGTVPYEYAVVAYAAGETQ